MKVNPISRKQNIVVQELENELLVYDLQTNKVVCLNEISAMVFQLCDGTRTVAEISDLMSENLKTSVPEDIVWLALDSFKKENLLEDNQQFPIDLKGLTRRQVIKKIGLGTMIAFPLISNLIAPTAANAASLPNFCIRNSPGCIAPGGIYTSIQPNSPDCFLNPPGFRGCCSCDSATPIEWNPTTFVCRIPCA